MKYNIFRVPKKNGKWRTIAEPSADLKAIQLIIKDVLDCIPIHESAHGFVVGRDIVSNAKRHRQKRYVLNIDVKNFFPSVRRQLMLPILRDHVQDEELLEWIVWACFLEDALPQGAPSSPILANVYMKEIDLFLEAYCQNSHWSYSRYADDLTISGGDTVKEGLGAILKTVDYQLGLYGLVRNKKKTKLMPYYQRQVVTGIVVNNERLTLSSKTRDRLFLDLKGRSRRTLSESELGYLEHVRHVDPLFYEKLCTIMV